MDYYNKYLKYKTKYLNLLKGGIVPQIDCDLLPFENTNINIIYKGRFILKNNENSDNNYLLNDNYELEKTQIPINKPLFDIPDLSMLANLNVKLGYDDIPFHVGSLQFNFNIIIGIINYINYFNDNILKKKDGRIRDAINSFKLYYIQKIFHIDVKSEPYIFLGISNHNSILNCFSFFNKLHEFLNYILLNEYDQQKFNKLFPNLENIKDFYNIYSYFYQIKNKQEAIKEYLQSSSNIFYDDIIKFKNFINYCNIIDKHIEFKSMFGISLINLILINWIYLRSLRTNLVIGSLSSNLYPISKLNFFENIFQMSEKNIHDYAEKQKQLNNENDINKLLLKKIGVPIIPYGQSTYKGDSFPNCVENTILQLLKILAWKNDKYYIDLLPEGISECIKKIIERINQEPLKIETKEIMDDFVVLVSAINNIDYRDGQNPKKDHNIASNKKNVGNILNYIFNSDTIKGGIEDYNDQIFKKINDNTEEYSLEQKDNIIIIDKNSFKINIIIKDGHASIDDKIDMIYRFITTYKYLNILYTFNYTKDDSINFDKNFINFCIDQSQVIKNFLTNKIINIQKISLTEHNSKDEIGYTCLHIACILDNLEKLKEYKQLNYADINNIDNEGNTPLLIASLYGNLKCINFLIENCSDIEITNKLGNTSLSLASHNGYINCIKYLIEKGANIEHNNNMNNTPLLLASQKDHIECLKFLIKKGAHLNHINKNGDTALLLASKFGNLECIKLLFENFAKVNILNNDGNTALSLAATFGKVVCVNFLIANCFNVNHINNYGNTPLLLASIGGYIECIKLLFKNGANINYINKDGLSSLSFASSGGHIESIKFLIENNANVDNIDNEGDTPLLLASIKGHVKCVELLIKEGANVNKTNKSGNTPLLIECAKGRSESVKLLIENGAKVNITNVDDNTPLSLASREGHSECVKLLIEKDKDIDHINNDGDTPLLLASTNGHVNCVKLLLEKGADINYTNDEGDTPLIWASNYGHIECVKLLILNRADVNHTNNSGYTPLSYASTSGKIECVKLLIENGADVNHKNKSGNTPLLLASEKGYLKCIKLLIEKGANVNHANNRGRTSLYLASNKRHSECVKFLIEKGAH
jgi:ankyrin repeat protein